MNKKLKKSLSLILLVGFIGFAFTFCLSALSNKPGSYIMDTSNIENKFTDIAYAPKSETQKLDIYLPDEGNGPFPVIIAIHGGGFFAGSKNDRDLTIMLQGLERGYAVVAVDYRLSDEATFPAAITDVKAAIRFIKVNAAQYKLNPDRIALWGSSAGGNLASLAGTTGGTNNCYDTALGNANVSDNVTAVVDWFGPANFSVMDEQNRESGISEKVEGVQIHSKDDSFGSKYFGQNISKVPDLCRQADPATYITSDCPPFLIQHGKLDPVVPAKQSVDLANAIAKKAGPEKVTLVLFERAGHGGRKFENARNMDRVFAFLDKHMKN
jgi:acetyl esterase/lipase